MFWRWFLCLLYLLGGLSLAGCGLVQEEGGEIVLAAPRDLVPGPKDPYYASGIMKVWEPLVGISDDGKAVPVLATSWQSSDDRRVWTFQLREGVSFQDGKSFDSTAVVKNFTRYAHMGYRPSSFYGFLIDRIYPGLSHVEAVDAHQVRLYFKKPVPMLIYRMAGWGSAMFSPACFDEETGDFTDVARGTGPFRIAERKADEYAVVERFEGYWGEKAEAKRIRVRVIPAPETRYSAMRSGEVMGVLDLGGMPPILAEELLKTGKFEAHAAKSTISHYLSVNGTRFPFNDERMRKAVNLAVDREKIVRHYFRGYGTPTMNFLNSTNPFSHVVPPVYNPEEAERLAAAVLEGKRQNVTFLIPQYGVDRYPYKVIAELIQAELRPLGLDVTIRLADGMTLRKRMKSGDYDLSIGTRGLGNLDPTSLLSEFFSTNGATNKASCFGYSNPRVDADFQMLAVTYDVKDRAVLYRDILDELLRHPVVVPLLEDQNLAVYSNKLSGYHASVYGITLDKVHWAAQKKGKEDQ